MDKLVGGVTRLVPGAAFKAVVRLKKTQVGSIPIHLRQKIKSEVLNFSTKKRKDVF